VGGERLLRLCRGDEDWLEIDQKAGQKLQITARYDFAHGELALEAFDEGGSSSLGRGQMIAPRLPGPVPASGDDSPVARRGRTATTGLALEAGKIDRKIKLRVFGGPDVANFYILRIQEPPPPGKNKDQQNKDDKKKDDKDKQKKDDKKKEEQKKKEKQKEEDKKEEDQETRRKQQRQRMERNDRNPANLEAQQALRNSPFRNLRPSKDW